MTLAPDLERSVVLLEKFKPVLVIFPQTSRDGTELHRPGAWLPVAGNWGDYHPCPVEFLLDRVTQRDEPKRWSFSLRGFIAHHVLRDPWSPSPRTGIGAVQARATLTGPEGTDSWELDVADIPSQNETLAWKQNAEMVRETVRPFRPTVYGRIVAAAEACALQYWYLYVYNDFWNNHECDWEMATVVLRPDETPDTVAYSQHIGGSQRAWADVRKVQGRPVLYVARGSHAGYFDYAPGGHLPVNVNTGVEHPVLPRPLHVLDPLVSPLLKMLNTREWTRRGKDNPPADRELDTAKVRSQRHYGIRLETELKVIPAGQPPADPDDPDWWWLNLRCPWGSRHQRVFGFSDVIGPWASNNPGDTRWRDPVRWAAETPRDIAG
jgi:hypothetical protein